MILVPAGIGGVVCASLESAPRGDRPLPQTHFSLVFYQAQSFIDNCSDMRRSLVSVPCGINYSSDDLNVRISILARGHLVGARVIAKPCFRAVLSC